MLPSAKILTIVGLVSFCSNWQFGFQITYINTASRAFYALADEIYQRNHPPSTSANASITSPHLPQKEWSQHWSAIVSAFYAGALIGFILVPRLIRKIDGVRNALLWSSLPAVLGCLLQLFVRLSTSNLYFDLLLSAGRLLVGIQAGCSLCLLPLFIIETSDFAHRPFLSSLQQVFQALATLLGLFVGSDSLVNLGPYKLECLQLISLSPTMFFLCFLIWLPETPFRLLEKCQQEDSIGKEDELELAFEQSSLFYYGPKADFGAIRAEAFHRWAMPSVSDDSGRKKRWQFIDNLKGLIIGTLASISFPFTADDLIDSYSADFLSRSLNTSNSDAESLTALLGLLLFITSIFGAFLVENFGRRPLLISGLIGTALSNAMASVGASIGSIVMVTTGFAFTKAFVGFGAGAPAWFLTSELVSPLFVAQAQAISTGSLLIITGLCTLSFLSLEAWLGSGIALLCLSTVPALIIAFVLFLMLPETRDQPFEQVRHQLANHPLPGLARHPKWSRALLSPLLGADGDDGTQNGKFAAWERSWELPHRAQRLMSASSYVSYGSLMHSPRPIGNHPPPPPPLYRRHSTIPANDQIQSHNQNSQQSNCIPPPPNEIPTPSLHSRRLTSPSDIDELPPFL